MDALGDNFKQKLQQLFLVGQREYLHDESLEIGKSLTEMLLRKNGLEELLLALNDLGGEQIWQNSIVLSAIAKILAKKPIRVESHQKYYAFILREFLLLAKKEHWALKFHHFTPILLQHFHSKSAHCVHVNFVDKLLAPFEILIELNKNKNSQQQLKETWNKVDGNFRLNESIWLCTQWLKGLPTSGPFTCHERLEKMLPLWILLLGQALSLRTENTSAELEHLIADMESIVFRLLRVNSLDQMKEIFVGILLKDVTGAGVVRLCKISTPLVVPIDSKQKHPRYGYGIAIDSHDVESKNDIQQDVDWKMAAFNCMLKKLTNTENTQLLIHLLGDLCPHLDGAIDQTLTTKTKDDTHIIGWQPGADKLDLRLRPHYVLSHVLEELSSSEMEFNGQLSADMLHVCEVFLNNYIARLENTVHGPKLDIRLRDELDSEMAQIELQSLKFIIGIACASVLQIEEGDQKSLELLKGLAAQMTQITDLLNRNSIEQNAELVELLAGIEHFLEFLRKDLLLDFPNDQAKFVEKTMLIKQEACSKKPNSIREILANLDASALEDDLSIVNCGHHLIQIVHLLRRRDMQTFSEEADSFEQLFTKLTELLEANDSYVFLAAINALAELLHWQTDLFLARMVGLFRDWRPSGGVASTSGDTKSLIVRAKVGEVLAKVARNLGDFSAHYFDEIATALSTLIKESTNDEMIRASALSAFADLLMACRGRYFDRYMQELLYCVDQLLQFDKNALVRRAAIHLLRSMVTSASNSSTAENGGFSALLETFSDSLAPIVRRLRSLRREDMDHIVRLHAELALIEIEESLKISFKP